MHAISATELARNTRDILDRVVTQGEVVTVERNRTVIAQIKPPQKSMTASQALSGLTFPLLSPLQASDWLRESKEGFDDLESAPWA